MAIDLLRAIIGLPRQVHNASTANQSGFAADTYLAGSACAIPNGLAKIATKYRCRFNVVKTAAGVAAPILNVRVGTAGTVADASRGTLTFSAQTAVVDEGVYEVECVFRVVGASAILQVLGWLKHRLSITGLGVGVSEPEIATSAAFTTLTANLIIGVSVNGGTAAAWTVSLVSAELVNLL